nr:MAG TPA: minor tail protein [Caudoviricetes sp.]
MAADGSVIIDTRMDTSGVQNGVSAIKQSFNGLGSAVKKIGLLIGGAFAVGKLVQFGKECLELGSDLAEVQNVVDVTFTTMSDKVNEFAKNAMTTAGLSETMAKRYVGTFGAMSKSFGFSEQQAYDMSTALTQLTGDVASFYNISQDLAYIKLKSVFTGETETLKDLGVVMTQSALDQYALANGYGKTTSAMTEQEKVALRLAFVQKQLSAASGDFIRTSDSWANQVRIMQLQLRSLKATVGQGLINIFSPVLKVINTLLAKLATLANAFKSFTELITGKKSSGATGAASAGIAGANIAETAEGYGTAADNAEDLADATKETAKETKKAQKASKDYLSTLDEIHKVTSNDSVSSSPSGSSGSKGNGLDSIPKAGVGSVDYGNLAEGENALDKVSESAKKLADLLKKIWKPFQDAWKNEGKNTVNAAIYSFSSLGTLAKDVGASIVKVWTNGTGATMLSTMLQIAQNVLITIGNITSRLDEAWKKNEVGTTIIQNIANALQAVLTFVNNIANDTARWAENLDFYPLLDSIKNLTQNFAPIIQQIGSTFEFIYNNIILPALKWVIETGIPTIINIVSDLLGFISKHQGIVETFGAVLVGAFAAGKIVSLATTIIGAVSKIIGIGKNVITLITGAGGIMSGIKALVAALGPGGIFAIAITAAIAVGVLLYKNWDKICEAATKLKDWVIDKTRTLVTNATNLLTNLREKISNIWTAVQTKTHNVWTNVTTFVSNKVEAIRSAIVDKFTAAKEKVVSVFTGIKDTIRDVLNNVIGIVNGAIGTVNSAIGGIESAFTFGPWKVPTPFGSRTIGFTANFPRVPTIPYLAKGAVIPPRSEFLAVLGDQKNGRNLEAPEDLLRQIVREEAGGNQRSGGNYRFTVQLNRRTIFDEMIDEAKLRRDASGTNPFELA